MENQDLHQLKQGEADFFDEIAEVRTGKPGFIAIEADLRRGTKYIPQKGERVPLVDRKLTDMLQGAARDKYIAMVSQKRGATWQLRRWLRSRLARPRIGEEWLSCRCIRHFAKGYCHCQKNA